MNVGTSDSGLTLNEALKPKVYVPLQASWKSMVWYWCLKIGETLIEIALNSAASVVKFRRRCYIAVHGNTFLASTKR
jgi:hypothetical protein